MVHQMRAQSRRYRFPAEAGWGCMVSRETSHLIQRIGKKTSPELIGLAHELYVFGIRASASQQHDLGEGQQVDVSSRTVSLPACQKEYDLSAVVW